MLTQRKKSGITLLMMLMLHLFTAQTVMAAALNISDSDNNADFMNGHCEMSQQAQEAPESNILNTGCCEHGSCVCTAVAGFAVNQITPPIYLANIYLPSSIPAVTGLNYPPFLHPPQ